MSNNNLKYSSNRVTSKDWNVKNEENKIIVNERFKQDLQQDKTGKGYICPICGSGSGDKGTGITENPKNPYHYTCWAGCFKNCDAFDILALKNGIPTRSEEAMQYAFSLYNVDNSRSNDKIQSMKENPVKKQVKTTTTLDFTEKINRSSSLFVGSKAEKYINNRGISTELAQRFKLGYSESEYFPDKQNHPALIIPVSKNFYISRNIDANTSDKARFSNVKGSKSTIFNLDAIKQSDRPIFIVEGAIDALSIMEVKGQAIALNSTSNADLLVRQLENLKQLPPFVLCLDNDKAGQKATDTLITALTRLTARFIDGRFIFGECKDANEILMKNKPALARAVTDAEQQALTASAPEPQAGQEQERPPFIAVKFNKAGESYEQINKRELTVYIRENVRYFSVVDDEGNRKRFTYINNCYIPTDIRTFGDIVAEPVKQYNIRLVEAKFLDEVVSNLDYLEQTKKIKEINSDSTYVNMLNGIVNVFTGEVLPHTPDMYITRQLPCTWLNEIPETPVFDKYMNDLTEGNEGIKHFLMEYMGCIFSNVSGTGFKQALFQKGKGNTGKSQLKLLVEKILGSNNYTSIDLKELEEDKFSISTLYNKRLAGSSDMKIEHVKSMSKFKALTGGDNILIQKKFGHPFNMQYDGFLWFCTNKLPTFGGDKDKHVYERMLILEHHNVIPVEKRDPFLIDKLLNEKNGIVMKCIITARNAIRTKKFTIPPEVKINTANYALEGNSVARFLGEAIKPFEDRQDVFKKQLYDAYKRWYLSGEGTNPVKKSDFYIQVADLYNKSVDEVFKRTERGIKLIGMEWAEDFYRDYKICEL